MHVPRQYTDVYQYYLVKYGRDVGKQKFHEYLSKKSLKTVKVKGLKPSRIVSKETRPTETRPVKRITRSLSANVPKNNTDNIMYNIIFKKRTRRRNIFIT